MKSFYNYQTIDKRGRRISYLIESNETDICIYSTMCSLEDQFSRKQGKIELQKKKEKDTLVRIPIKKNDVTKTAISYIYNNGILAYSSKKRRRKIDIKFYPINTFFQRFIKFLKNNVF